MLFQPSNISPDEISGTGCIDASKDLTVSWQVSGDSAMIAYQVDIYTNDAQSTMKFSTSKIPVEPAFWGVDYKGNTQYFSALITKEQLAAAGIINGEEYKLLITQYWNMGNIQQTTASIFITRDTPQIAIDYFPSPLTGREKVFTASYTQPQNDAIQWVRWEIAEKGSESKPFIDTGKIRGTGELRVSYDGFYTNTIYVIKCTISTENGIEATTGWTEFGVSYAVTPPQGNVRARQLPSENCLFVEWDRMELALGYSILRQKVGDKTLHKVAETDGTTGQIKDYGVHSGEEYVYYVFPSGADAYLTEPMVSTPISVNFWCWAITEAIKNADGSYSATATYMFRFGRGGVSEGDFSNNNSPQIFKNFTPYPVRMGDTANYLSGSVGGLIGKITEQGAEYRDTLDEGTALMALSTTKNTLFLSDPKGHFLIIATNSPVTISIEHKSAAMTQTAHINWTEIESSEGISLYSAPGGDFYPSDAVFATQFEVDIATGALMWKVPEGYTRNNGSIILINDAGELLQTTDGAFVPASMSLDRETMEVTATIS